MRSSLSAAILLAISSVALAAPTSLEERAIKKINAAAICDLSQVSVPLVDGLPGPSAGLVLGHVAIGRGTQNYTCDLSNSTAVPKANGAKATLYNVTCLTTSPQSLVATIPALALDMDAPTDSNPNSAINLLTSGHHYFTNATTPFFDFRSDVPHNYGTVATAKLAAAPAPKDAPAGDNGMGAVPWLKLAGVAGDYKEVFRVDTAGGSPPASCTGQKANFEIDYAATYYFYKST